MLFGMNINILFYLILLIFYIFSSVSSIPLQPKPATSISNEYKRLATHCYINDYAAWLDRQDTLMFWLNIAKILKVPVEKSELLQKEMEQIRLQQQCLRFIERLPVSVGPG
ncbi:hypothetical protein I4U23_009308 [Adineta vaga]|nr:hypothetical protein I4U23_009308 [Adineta vaga]